MQDINKVELQGTIGRVFIDRVGKELGVAKISLVTSHAYKTADGGAVVETTWHSIIITEKTPWELDWLRMGMKIHVTGRYRVNRYVGSDGYERVLPEVVADDIETLKED